MTESQSLENLLETFPYVVWHGVEISVDEDDLLALRMSFRDDLGNYAGSFHAGALYTLAETVAGVMADRAVPGNSNFTLLRGAEVKYTRRPDGDVVATARRSAANADTALAAFEANGRADIIIDVNMLDNASEKVFEGQFDFALRSRKKD